MSTVVLLEHQHPLCVKTSAALWCLVLLVERKEVLCLSICCLGGRSYQNDWYPLKKWTQVPFLSPTNQNHPHPIPTLLYSFACQNKALEWSPLGRLITIDKTKRVRKKLRKKIECRSEVLPLDRTSYWEAFRGEQKWEGQLSPCRKEYLYF